MADLSQVLGALRDAIAAILYPSGVPAGPAPLSVAGASVRVFAGWPNANLDADLRNGFCQVSVWPRPGLFRDLGPYLDGWKALPRAVPSLLASVAEDAATFSGNATEAGMVVGLVLPGVASYGYAVQSSDTPASVAAALAALVSAGTPASGSWPAVPARSASASGAVLAVPGAVGMAVRIEAARREHRERRRGRQSVQITAWCPTAPLRDAIVALLDAAFLGQRGLALPDGTVATVFYEGTAYDEGARQQPLFRRDLLVAVEYVAVQERVSPPVVLPGAVAAPTDTTVRRVIIATHTGA